MKTDIYSLLSLKILLLQPPKAKLSTYINTRLLNTVLIHISVQAFLPTDVRAHLLKEEMKN